MRAEARAAWWLLAALLLAACDDDPRAEVLVVTREEGGPLDLDELVLRVDALDPGGEALVLEERTDARARYASGTLSPWSVLVRPSSERHVGSVLYRYRVEGRRGADVYVARQHRLGFVAGTRLTLPMRLAASCAGVACGEGQTCQDAVCRDDFLPSCPLAPAGSGCDEPVIDAGPTPDATPGLDAGDLGPAPDAGDSAVVDAGDSAVVDAGDSGPPDAGDAGSADAAVPRLCGTGDCEPQVIAAGWSHTCAALNDSRLVCWGRNNQGQLGREPTGEAFPRPAAVPDLSVTPSAFFPPRPDYLGAGSEHTCVVVDDDGPTMCFGANADWQVRAMGPPRSSVPLEGMRSGGRLSVGGAQACLVSAPATICWGRNDRGQLGNGGTMSPLIVSLLPLPDGSVVRDLSLGADHGCATIMTAGIDFRVHCWGVNDLGQVGDGTNAQRESPVPITSAGTGALVAAGHDHSCYATAAGEVLCWGPRALGDTPHAVADLPPVDAIAAGDGFTCALSAGSVWCWGSNVYGQLGTGTTGGTAGPSRVPGIDFAAQLAVGRFHVCVVEDVPGDAPARILCWGRNDHGQLGDGTTEDRASPVNVVAE